VGDVTSGTRRQIIQRDGTIPHFDRQVTADLNQRLENLWIGRRGPIPWPPISPDLTAQFLYVRLTKEIVCGMQVHMRNYCISSWLLLLAHEKSE
jgi:hypothetical protein